MLPPPLANSSEYIYEDEYGYLGSFSYVEYGYEDGNTYGVEGDSADYSYTESGYGYVIGEYDYGGYIGDAPELVYTGNVVVEIDDRGNVTTYPARDDHGVVLDGDYIRVYLPGWHDPTDISIALPVGWTYVVNHKVEEFENLSSLNLDEYNSITPSAASRTYTVITFNHNWNDTQGSGYIGFMPFALNPPGGFSVVTLPAPFDLPAWNNVFNNNPGNLVISVPQTFDLAGTVTIPAGRNIIIVSQGTNLNSNLDIPPVAPATTVTINRTVTAGRHFNVAAGSTLTLSHIVLNGGIPPVGVFRGGISLGDSHLIMRMGSVISGNRGLIGGAVGLGGSSSLHMTENAAIRGNNANNGGGIAVSTAGGSTVRMSGNSIVENNISTIPGGGINLFPNTASVLTIEDNAQIIGNSNETSSGGGLSTGVTTIVNMYGGIIEGNFGPFGGGIATSGAVNMHGGTIQGNSSPIGGGIAVVGGGTFTMTGGVIRNNRNTLGSSNPITEGGGVFVRDSTTIFTMTGGIIGDTNPNYGNRAQRGGGVWVGGGATFNMNQGGTSPNYTSGTIIGNTALNSGSTDVGDFVMSHHHSGGGVYVSGSSALLTAFNMTAGQIRNNLAIGSGGGVAVGGGTFTMFGGHIHHNQAARGGGATVRYSGTFNMHGGTISNHVVPDAGAAVQVDDGDFNMHGGTIEHNSGGAGGIHVRFFTARFTMHDGIIRSNSTVGNGGVRVVVGGSFVMHGGHIYNNTGSSGGGVGVNGLSSVANGSIPSTFHMHGGVIGGTSPAYANTAASGAGVWVGNGARFYMQNYTPTGGGPTIPGTGVIESNHAAGATGEGGGVHISDTSTFNMYAGAIRHNIVADPATLSGHGGGVYLTRSARFYMRGGEIYGHENLFSGGGVYLVGWAPEHTPVFTMYGGVIRDNTSGGGSGVASLSHAQINIHGGYIRSNHTIGTTGTIIGGGIASISGGVGGSASFTMTGGTIEHNTSQGGAGGIWLNAANSLGNDLAPTNDTYISITGGIIRHNTAYGNGTANIFNGGGGGIFFVSEPRNGTTFGGPNLQIYENRAYGAYGGGGVLVHGQRVEMTAGTIRNNYASAYGGGVLIFSPNLEWQATTGPGFILSNGIIFGNNASYGGGVAVRDGSLIMTGGIIGGNSENGESNIAVNGGGVWVGDEAEFNLQGSNPKSITGNEAEYGGGVWVSADGYMIMDSDADNVFITFNIAEYMGGGIYTQRHEYEIQLERIPGATLLPSQTYAYSNLTLFDVYFAENSANSRYVPPVNATAVLPDTLPNRAFINTSQPTNPTPIRVHPLNNYDINFRADDVLFEFFKTNEDGVTPNPGANLLPGARFRLFRADAADLGGTGTGGLVTEAALNAPNSPWEAVDMILYVSESGLGADPIAFEMTPGFIYQLVEYLAPAGFQIPLGQWRMWVDADNVPDIIFQSIGGTTPAFIYHSTGHYGVNRFLPNMLQFGLPLTGGTGTQMFILAGSMVLAMTVLALSIITIKRKLAVKPVK